MSIEENIASPSQALPPKASQGVSGSSSAPTLNSRLPGWQRVCAALRRLSRSSQFVIAASIILGLTMTFVGNLVSKTIERSAVQAAADTGALYMTTFLEPYVQELTTTSSLSVQTAQAIDHLMTSPTLSAHVISVKIWGPDGTILYSTNKDLVNKSFSTTEIALALQGKTVTEWGELDEAENSYERSLGIPLYEIYAPLREFGTGRIIAVGEFYELAEVLEQEINQVRREVWVIVGTATVSMLLLLFAIVHRGERIIVRQQQALSEHMHEQALLHATNIGLQRKITTANQAFSRINELTLRRIGADLHDGPAQLLTLILVRVDELNTVQGRNNKNGAQPEGDALETIRNAAQDALREVREISRGLALPEINGMSLRQELEFVVQRHRQRTETEVDLTCIALPENVPAPHKVCIYRFIQEALNNAYRHADAKGQAVLVSYARGLLTIQVTDTGDGMESDRLMATSEGRTRLGLAGMRYRVESLGGKFHIQSMPGAGTGVCAQFKLGYRNKRPSEATSV